MRVIFSDDENDDIIDSSTILNLDDDTSSTTFLETEMVTKKTAPKATADTAAEATAVAKAPKAKAPKAEAGATKAKGTFGPRATPEGYTGINELATELDISPTVARRKLRTAEGVTKPEGQHGWYWKTGSKDLAAVRKLLTKAD